MADPGVFRAQVLYWYGDTIDSSEPDYTLGPAFTSRDEALAWGRALVGTDSPGIGEHSDHIEVIEYRTVDDVDEEVGVFTYEDEVRRFIYIDGEFAEEVTAD